MFDKLSRVSFDSLSSLSQRALNEGIQQQQSICMSVNDPLCFSCGFRLNALCKLKFVTHTLRRLVALFCVACCQLSLKLFYTIHITFPQFSHFPGRTKRQEESVNRGKKRRRGKMWKCFFVWALQARKLWKLKPFSYTQREFFSHPRTHTHEQICYVLIPAQALSSATCYTVVKQQSLSKFTDSSSSPWDTDTVSDPVEFLRQLFRIYVCFSASDVMEWKMCEIHATHNSTLLKINPHGNEGFSGEASMAGSVFASCRKKCQKCLSFTSILLRLFAAVSRHLIFSEGGCLLCIFHIYIASDHKRHNHLFFLWCLPYSPNRPPLTRLKCRPVNQIVRACQNSTRTSRLSFFMVNEKFIFKTIVKFVCQVAIFYFVLYHDLLARAWNVEFCPN